jgi:hypothetical protein
MVYSLLFVIPWCREALGSRIDCEEVRTRYDSYKRVNTRFNRLTCTLTFTRLEELRLYEYHNNMVTSSYNSLTTGW